MPIRADLHGNLHVEVVVPMDARATIRRNKLSRIVNHSAGDTVESVQTSLHQIIRDATPSHPYKIIIELDATGNGIEWIVAAIEKTLGKIPGVRISVAKPQIRPNNSTATDPTSKN
jgi:hypothetical protein